jgi:hypothetical protein
MSDNVSLLVFSLFPVFYFPPYSVFQGIWWASQKYDYRCTTLCDCLKCLSTTEHPRTVTAVLLSLKHIKFHILASIKVTGEWKNCQKQVVQMNQAHFSNKQTPGHLTDSTNSPSSTFKVSSAWLAGFPLNLDSRFPWLFHNFNEKNGPIPWLSDAKNENFQENILENKKFKKTLS